MLPDPAQQAMRNWLRKPELEEILRLAESKQKTHEAEMTNLSTESMLFPRKAEEANASSALAYRYRIFAEVLREFRDSKEPFTHVKLT